MKRLLALFSCALFLSISLSAQTGISIPEMSTCDNLVNNFLSTYSIPGATVAIAKDGKLVYHRAFGNADGIGQETAQPYHIFRIASISKPITSITVMKMIEEGELNLTDKVFGVGGILENHEAQFDTVITDNRIYDITVQQLLEHTAGFDRGVNCFPNPTSPYPWEFGGCDPIVAPLHVTETLEVPNPATEENLIAYLLQRGLDFTPGTNFAYSNIGYLVLGEIIEEISGLSYEAYVQENILAPLGICDMHIGKNLLADKRPREGEYVGNNFLTFSCYEPGIFVPWEYGGFNLEAMDAHGGWIATSRDLVRLLVAVDGFSTKPDIINAATIETMTTGSVHAPFYAKGWSVNSADNWWHTGALDGTASIFARTNNGFTWAVILNKRVADASLSNQFWTDLDGLPWSCLSNASTFPTHDLMDLPTANSDNITFSNVTGSSVDLSWAGGNGMQRIVIAKAGTIRSYPLDGIDYQANGQFGAGTDLGENTFVVYNGTDNSTTVTGLNPETDYTFQVFDYNQSSNTGNHALYLLCGNEPATITTSMSTSIEELEQEKIVVFPNPATDQITIRLNEITRISYQILDINGKLLKAGVLTQLDNRLDISQLVDGVYILELQMEDTNIARKLLVRG